MADNNKKVPAAPNKKRGGMGHRLRRAGNAERYSRN